MKIYVFGNPLNDEDSLPLKLLERLRQRFKDIEFVCADPNENFPPEGEKDLIILDTVKGISEVVLLDLVDLKETKKTPISLHDYDLLFHLKLLFKLEKIRSVKIIGVPDKKNSQRFFASIKHLIVEVNSTSLSGSGRRKTYRDQRHGLTFLPQE